MNGFTVPSLSKLFKKLSIKPVVKWSKSSVNLTENTSSILVKYIESLHTNNNYKNILYNEPVHDKTSNLHMRKQIRRSAVQ